MTDMSSMDERMNVKSRLLHNLQIEWNHTQASMQNPRSSGSLVLKHKLISCYVLHYAFHSLMPLHSTNNILV